MVDLVPLIMPEGRLLLLEFNEQETRLTQEAALPYLENFRDKSDAAKRVGSILIGSLEVAEYRHAPLEIKMDLEEFPEVTREMLYVYYNRCRGLLHHRRNITSDLPVWLQEEVDIKTYGRIQPVVATDSPLDKTLSLKLIDKKLKGSFQLAKRFKELAETKLKY